MEIAAQGLIFNTKISKPTLYSYIDKGIFLRITNKDLPVKGIRKAKYKKSEKAGKSQCRDKHRKAT